MMKKYEKPLLSVAEIELANVILTSVETVAEKPNLPTAAVPLNDIDFQTVWKNLLG